MLEVQKQARHLKSDPNLNLITPQELYKIRQLWQFEEKDWDDSLPKIFFEVTGENLDWLEDDWSGLGGAEKKVLDEVSEECGVPNGLLTELLDIERKLSGMSKRSGIFKEIDEVLRKDWRTYEEATGKTQSVTSDN